MGIVKLPCDVQDVLGSFVEQQVGQAGAQVLSSQLGYSWNVLGSDAYQLWVIFRAIFMLGEGRMEGSVSTQGERRRACFLPFPPPRLSTWAGTWMVACMVSCMPSEPSRLQTPPVRYSWERKQVPQHIPRKPLRIRGSSYWQGMGCPGRNASPSLPFHHFPAYLSILNSCVHCYGYAAASFLQEEGLPVNPKDP